MQEEQKPICRIRRNGDKVWTLDGFYHREDGPAIEDISGDKFWFINGQLHRLDGPASEFADGTKEWFWHDRFIPVKSQKQFERYLKLKAFW